MASDILDTASFPFLSIALQSKSHGDTLKKTLFFVSFLMIDAFKFWRNCYRKKFPLRTQLSSLFSHLRCYVQSLLHVACKNHAHCSAFNFSFHKLCLILKGCFLIRFPPNFQERFLMSSASPEFVFWGPEIKQLCFKQVKVDLETYTEI